MALYNLVNIATDKNIQIDKKGNVPSYMKIGVLPFSRLYLVSKDRERTQQFSNLSNQNTDGSIDLRLQQLSQKGALRFYGERYILGKLSFILGESLDLDSGDERIAAT